MLAAGFPADRDGCAIETPEGRTYSWADIERGSARIANLLAGLGLPAGARIAVQVEKSPEALLLYLGTLRAGCVFLPLNTAYQAAEIDYFVENAEPSVVVCAPGSRDWIEPVVARHRVPHLFTLGQHGDAPLDALGAKGTVGEHRGQLTGVGVGPPRTEPQPVRAALQVFVVTHGRSSVRPPPGDAVGASRGYDGRAG